MKVYIERTKENKNVKAKNVIELLEKLNLNPTAVLVIRNNLLITESEKLNDKDEIKIISVVSGG